MLQAGSLCYNKISSINNPYPRESSLWKFLHRTVDLAPKPSRITLTLAYAPAILATIFAAEYRPSHTTKGQPYYQSHH